LLSCVHQTHDRIYVYHVLIISYLYPALYHILSLSYLGHQTEPKSVCTLCFTLSFSRPYALLSNMKHFKPSVAPWTSTPDLVKRSMYSPRVSFLSWTMAVNTAIIFGHLRLAVNLEVNSLHNSPHELIELSCRPLNQVVMVFFKVKTNNLHFTVPLARR